MIIPSRQLPSGEVGGLGFAQTGLSDMGALPSASQGTWLLGTLPHLSGNGPISRSASADKKGWPGLQEHRLPIRKIMESSQAEGNLLPWNSPCKVTPAFCVSRAVLSPGQSGMSNRTLNNRGNGLWRLWA